MCHSFYTLLSDGTYLTFCAILFLVTLESVFTVIVSKILLRTLHYGRSKRFLSKKKSKFLTINVFCVKYTNTSGIDIYFEVKMIVIT